MCLELLSTTLPCCREYALIRVFNRFRRLSISSRFDGQRYCDPKGGPQHYHRTPPLCPPLLTLPVLGRLHRGVQRGAGNIDEGKALHEPRARPELGLAPTPRPSDHLHGTSLAQIRNLVLFLRRACLLRGRFPTPTHIRFLSLRRDAMDPGTRCQDMSTDASNPTSGQTAPALWRTIYTAVQNSQEHWRRKNTHPKCRSCSRNPRPNEAGRKDTAKDGVQWSVECTSWAQ